MSKNLLQFEINAVDGEYIFREGELGDSVFMLQSGKVKLVQKRGTNEKLLKVVKPDEFFGETIFTEPQSRKNSAIAVGDCILIKIDQNAFAKLAKTDIDIVSGYIAYLYGCLQDTNGKIDYFNKKYEKQKIHSNLMKELLLNGKKDRSRKWTLVDLNGFVADNVGILSRKEIMSLVDKMFKAGIIHIKTDRTKNLWIGVRSNSK